MKITAASKIVGKYIKRSHKTVEKWRVDFLKGEGELPEFLRGTYARMDSVASDENLTMAAKEICAGKCFQERGC